MGTNTASYYDVMGILAEETDVPVTFATRVPGLGTILDPAGGEKDLPKGAKTKIPLWLMSVLAQRNMVQVRLPAAYGQKIRRKMQAGCEVEDLRIRTPFFYDVAGEIQPYLSEHIASFAEATFRARYKALLTKAHSTDTGPDAIRLAALLSNEEKIILEAGRVSMIAFEHWRVNAWATRRPAVKRRAKENAPDGGNSQR